MSGSENNGTSKIDVILCELAQKAGYDLKQVKSYVAPTAEEMKTLSGPTGPRPLDWQLKLDWLLEKSAESYFSSYTKPTTSTITATPVPADMEAQNKKLYLDRVISLVEESMKMLGSPEIKVHWVSTSIPSIRLAIYLLENDLLKTLKSRQTLKDHDIFTKPPLMHPTLANPVHQEMIFYQTHRRLSQSGFQITFPVLTHNEIIKMYDRQWAQISQIINK